MFNPIELKIDSIDLNSVVISLIPAVIGLQKDDLKISLNEDEFTDYSIIDESTGSGNKYSIIPDSDFLPYDILDIQILREYFESDKFKIVFAKSFSHNTAEINFKLPENGQGKYVIKLITVNEREFNISSNTIVVCNLID